MNDYENDGKEGGAPERFGSFMVELLDEELSAISGEK